MRNYLKYTLLIWVLPFSVASATTINVPADQPTIQAGIDTATAGDTVLVDTGTYFENINFNGKNIVVGSRFLTTGDTSYVSRTVIDGNQSGSVVTFASREDSSAILSGFTITNGNAGFGGGVYCYRSSPSLNNLIITGNEAQFRGGGIICYVASATVENIQLRENSAGGEGYYGSGGGISCYDSLGLNNYVSMTDVIISGNSASGPGGGIHCENTSITIDRAVIAHNLSVNHGGGLYAYSSGVEILNSTIYENAATDTVGGGISSWESSLAIVNSTISYNATSTSPYRGKGYGKEILGGSGDLEIVNSIIWNDNEVESVEEVILIWETTSDITFSDIQGGWSGEGNFDADPVFLDPANGNYRLSDYSPAIGAGTLTGAPSLDIEGNSRPNPPGSNPDIGAYENSRSEPLPPPAIHSVADITVLEDSIVSFILSADDLPEAVLQYQVFGHDSITAIIDDSLVTLQPASDFFASTPIPFYAQACNDFICGPVDTFYVTVLAVNDRPVATLSVVSVSDVDPTEIVLSGSPGPANESDQALSYVITALPDFGDLALSADGLPISIGDLPLVLPAPQVYFLPPLERFLSSTFTYQVTDDGGTENGGEDTSESLSVSLTLEVSDIFSLSTGGPIEGGVALIDANTLYTASSGDRVYRFDDSGIIEYTLNVAGDIKSSTTITPDHTVYIASTDNNLYSFNASGVSNPNWPLALGAEATASVAMDADKNIYIGTQNGIFQAVSPGGTVMWAYNVGAAVYASAAISLNNMLYIVNENGRLYAFDLSTLDPANVQYKWRIETGGNVVSSPALDDSSHVYLTTLDGRLLKVRDENTTGTVVWEYNTGSLIESSPIIDSEYTAYFGCDNSSVFAVSKTGDLKWVQVTGGSVKSTAALVEVGAETDRLYIGSNDGFLYAISLADGTIIWRYNAQSEIKAPTLYQSGMIYTGTIGGTIIALADPDVGQSLAKSTGAKRIWPTFQGDNARTGYQGSTALTVPLDVSRLPFTYELHQSYPNPFNPTSTIQFDLPEATDITLVIYDLLGREIVRLEDGWREAGYHQAIWNGRDSVGREVPTGIYIARLVTPEYVKSIKMLLLK